MRIIVVLLGTSVAAGVSACGSAGSTAASRPRPPTPIVLTALVTDAHLTVSPAHFGAGPVLLTVTNQGARAHSLVLSRAGRTSALARTAPINPQGTTQLPVDLSRGRYTLALASGGRSDAARSQAGDLPSATVRVGAERTGGGGDLLTP